MEMNLFEKFDVSPQIVSLNDQIKKDCEDRLDEMIIQYIKAERSIENQSKEFLFYRVTMTIIAGIDASLTKTGHELSSEEMMALYPVVGTLALSLDRLAEVLKDFCSCGKCFVSHDDSEDSEDSEDSDDSDDSDGDDD